MRSAIDGVFLRELRVIPTSGGPVLHMLRPDSMSAMLGTPGAADARAGYDGSGSEGIGLASSRPASAGAGLNIGEVYFSETEPGRVKAWKCHTRQTQRFAVPWGRLKIVLYDDRADSPSRGRVEEYTLGRPDAYRLLRIPPLVWYGFAALGDTPALLCNCPDMPHDPAEARRLDVNTPDIPYRW